MITVEYRDVEDMFNQAKLLVGMMAGEPVAPVTTITQVSAAPTTASTPPPAGPAPVVTPAANPAEPEVKSYTVEEVRAALSALSKAGKKAEVKAILESVGVSKLSDVQPEDYAAVMQKAGAV